MKVTRCELLEAIVYEVPELKQRYTWKPSIQELKIELHTSVITLQGVEARKTAFELHQAHLNWLKSTLKEIEFYMGLLNKPKTKSLITKAIQTAFEERFVI